MAKAAKRKTGKATTPTTREVERRVAQLALQRDVRLERRIQKLARQLRRELIRSDDALVDLARFVMDRLTEPEEEPRTEGDPPEGSPEDLEAHPWKKTGAVEREPVGAANT
jgi:hypothetical protein